MTKMTTLIQNVHKIIQNTNTEIQNNSQLPNKRSGGVKLKRLLFFVKPQLFMNKEHCRKRL